MFEIEVVRPAGVLISLIEPDDSRNSRSFRRSFRYFTRRGFENSIQKFHTYTHKHPERSLRGVSVNKKNEKCEVSLGERQKQTAKSKTVCFIYFCLLTSDLISLMPSSLNFTTQFKEAKKGTFFLMM